MKRAVLLLLTAATACGGAPFELGQLFPEDAGHDAPFGSHVEAGEADVQPMQEASDDAEVETADADGGIGKDAGFDVQPQEASVEAGTVEAGVDASLVDASLDAQVQDAQSHDAQSQDAAQEAEASTCTVVGLYDGTAQFDTGYPCGSTQALLPTHFAYEGPAFACGWQTTPDACRCAETYNCACLQLAQPCLAFGQAWKGCVEGSGNSAPVVSCK